MVICMSVPVDMEPSVKAKRYMKIEFRQTQIVRSFDVGFNGSMLSM